MEIQRGQPAQRIAHGVDRLSQGMPRLQQALTEAFARLESLDTAALLEKRYRKFRDIGGGEA